MKKFNSILFAFALFIFLSSFTQLSAQTIYFCEGVDDDGDPISSSYTFTIPNSGGYLYALIKMPYEIGCRSVSLEVYRNGKYDNTITIDTKNDWTWFWKQITFYKAGEYTIDVYDCDDEWLVTGSITIDKD
jgi:hypothetical protein